MDTTATKDQNTAPANAPTGTPVPDTAPASTTTTIATTSDSSVTSSTSTATPPDVSTAPTSTGEPNLVREGVENLLASEGDDEAAEVPISISPSTGPKIVALMFHGGTNAVAMLINLISKGYEVVPYYIHDDDFEGTERELRIAKSVIRIIRSSTKAVKDLVVVGTKIPKKQLSRRHRFYVELLTKELTGEGVNAIAYGCQPLEVGEDVSEDEAEDTDPSSLQECTPLEIITPDTLDIGSLAEQITPFISSTIAKEMMFASSSCKDPGDSMRECGDCDGCKKRFRLFTKLFGKDETKYLKGSWTRKARLSLKNLFEEKAKAQAVPTAEEISAILNPKKKKAKEEDDEGEEG